MPEIKYIKIWVRFNLLIKFNHYTENSSCRFLAGIVHWFPAAYVVPLAVGVQLDTVLILSCGGAGHRLVVLPEGEPGCPGDGSGAKLTLALGEVCTI